MNNNLKNDTKKVFSTSETIILVIISLIVGLSIVALFVFILMEEICISSILSKV